MKTLLLFFVFLEYCSQPVIPKTEKRTDASLPTSDSILYQRFTPPPGFKSVPVLTRSFAFYLRNLPLKPPSTKVLLYDGREKRNQNAHAAVVNLPIGKKDLHQCADAIMRLRAEYLWKAKRFDQIHFNLTNGFQTDYDRWRKGGRVKVTGNKTEWVQTATTSDSYAVFWKYLEFVFSYAGTLSLSKELKPRAFADMQIGDVFIQGGSPGHAVIVVDMAVNDSGKKIFLLAQSYMPAQEIQILKNYLDAAISPWYELDSAADVIETPEWRFGVADLKRF